MGVASRRWLVLTVCLLGLVLGLGVRAEAASAVPRPTEGGQYGYSLPEATPFVGAHAVVHYVSQGPDAPPSADANANGVPDYVELVSQAAEKSLGLYAQWGYFIPKDYGWPNELPDIYLHLLPATYFGLTFAPTSGEGGTFVVLSNHLDPALKSNGSLNATVAHELFHTVQYSYIPDGELPDWIAEGMAAAMELIVYPEYEDVVSDEYIGAWLDEPWRPLYDQSQHCVHCYGGAIWWYALNSADKTLIRDYLGRLWGYKKDGRPLLAATQPLDEILKQHGFKSLYQAYTSFSLSIYRQGLNPGTAYRLQAGKKIKATAGKRVEGLSTHYIPLTSAWGAKGLVVAVGNAGGPAPSVKLVLGGPQGRVLSPKLSDHGHRALFSVRFKSDKERGQVMLIITSGRQEGVRYKVAYGNFF